MPLDQTGNFDRDAVTSSIGSADTTIDVSDASRFPDPSSPPSGFNGEYNAVIFDADNYLLPSDAFYDGAAEIVRVTAIDTTNDTLTVTRGQEGTSAISHPSTAEIFHATTAKWLEDILSLDASEFSGANGTNGQVLQTDGTDASWADAGGGRWTEESGSPYTASATDSISISNLDSFDIVLVELKVAVDAGSANGISPEIQVNGDTGTNYDYYQHNGGTTNDASAWELSSAFPGETGRAIFTLHDYGEQVNFNVRLSVGNNSSTEGGRNTNITGPISSIDISESDTASGSWTVNVFGRDI